MFFGWASAREDRPGKSPGMPCATAYADGIMLMAWYDDIVVVSICQSANPANPGAQSHRSNGRCLPHDSGIVR